MSQYAKETVAKLQEILKARSLPTSGKKADLVARLQEADQAAEVNGMLPFSKLLYLSADCSQRLKLYLLRQRHPLHLHKRRQQSSKRLPPSLKYRKHPKQRAMEKQQILQRLRRNPTTPCISKRAH
jgi:hypothetical protein